MSKAGVSVIILTWNGLELVKECVSQVISKVKKWNVPHEIIIIDNGSEDDTVS